MRQSLIRSTGATFVGLILLCSMLTESRAAVVVVAVESGGDVVFTTEAGGSLDFTGMLFNGGSASSGRIDPTTGYFQVGDLELSAHLYFPPAIPLVPFGSGALSFSSSGTGDLFGMDASGVLILPSTYNSGDPLSGTATYAGETFASLGLTSGSYVWNLPNDTITLHIIPIPGAVWLFGSALWLLGWLRPR